MLNLEEISRYSRHILLPEIGVEGQEKLKRAKVLVIGAGGLGCPALLYLSAAGVGTIGVADNDKVDRTNLHRQVLYGENSIGKMKVEEAKKFISEKNKNINVNIYKTRIDEESALNIFPDYDIIIDGTDNFCSRYVIDDICKKLNKPLVYGAIHRFQGQVSVFNYIDGPSYRDLFEDKNDNNVPNCAQMGVLGILPGIVGMFQANEAIKIITGIGKILSGEMLVIDLLNMNFYNLTLQLNGSKEKEKSFC